MTNLEVVQMICAILERLKPEKPKGVNYYRDLITHVQDRPGHDQRYAIDATKSSSNWVGILRKHSRRDWKNGGLVFGESNVGGSNPGWQLPGQRLGC